jgi:hypothetical protein
MIGVILILAVAAVVGVGVGFAVAGSGPPKPKLAALVRPPDASGTLDVVLADACANGGATITAVERGGAASVASLHATPHPAACSTHPKTPEPNTITAIDGRPVTGAMSVVTALSDDKAGTTVSVTYRAGGSGMTTARIKLTPGIDQSALDKLCNQRSSSTVTNPLSDEQFLKDAEALVIPPAVEKPVARWLGVVQAEANLDPSLPDTNSQVKIVESQDLYNLEFPLSLCPASLRPPTGNPLAG